jgi:hypothetical protein
VGTALAFPPSNLGLHAVALRDSNGNGRRDEGEPIWLDMDSNDPSGGSHVTVGDVRITPQGVGLDGAPTRAEFNDALQAAGVKDTGGDYHASTATPQTRATIALALSGVALVLAAYAAVLARRQARPKNPFK